MAIIKWTPFLEPFDEMEKFMSDWQSSAARNFIPAIDVYETKNEVVVKTPLAGINPDDVKIGIIDDILTISGQAKKESEVDEKSYYRKEIRSGSFFRSVALPAHVIREKIQAESFEGMLKITLPKAPAAKNRNIKVKVLKPKGSRK